MAPGAKKSVGFTCSVPGCFNNDKRNRGISFYKFPKDKKLKKIGLQQISRKDCKPTNGHRVCSQHFEGGKKTYLNNVPTVFPLSKTHQKVNTEPRRTLIRVNTSARTANTIPSDRSSEAVNIEGGKELTDPDAPLAAELIQMEEKLEKLQNEMKVLSIKNEDDGMNYYTGMSSHHFLALFAFLNAGDICSRLRYWGSNNSSIQFPELEKKGQKRSLEPKDELFFNSGSPQGEYSRKSSG
ncbi:unnamed protein product [Porites lobata]|uniref:THAP-type domain-containing protein n=1 Tax=Porites lobata TaxID=104759 RepID=A0ABN8P3Q0_9CNID|nr:unnamed protein product [Porites lobata]